MKRLMLHQHRMIQNMKNQESNLQHPDERHNVKLTLSYDGTSYYGFQSQDHGNTIEDRLREAIGTIVKTAPSEVKLVTAGRTDTGVHAEAQCVNFFSDNRMHPMNWFLALNSLLPDDIRIQNVEFADDGFNARRSALYREYLYQIVNNSSISALDNRYCVHIYREIPDIGSLNQYAAHFSGERDWTSFCAIGDQNRTKTRMIYKTEFIRLGEHKIGMRIVGNAFLQHQVRIIVGTIIDMAVKGVPHEELERIIEAKDRTQAGVTFSPKGLILKKIYYTDELNLIK